MEVIKLRVPEKYGMMAKEITLKSFSNVKQDIVGRRNT